MTSGAYCEGKSKLLLEKEGAIVERAIPKIVWLFRGGRRMPMSISHDFFGLWDLIAVYPDGRTVYVQVKSGIGRRWALDPEKKRLMQEFPSKNKELHVWKKMGSKWELTREMILCPTVD